MPIVEASELCKIFRTAIRREGRFGALLSLISPAIREHTAVSSVSFQIERGESVAYLGPNGAGKSTTIKMLTGILVPSSGRVQINGIVPHKDRRRNSYQIGAVFGQRSQMLFDLPVKDTFDLLGHMYRIPRGQLRSRLNGLADMLEIGSLLDRPVRTLSLGQRMRCEIIASLLHEPEILFLDEPTIGLDVVAKERIRAFIQEINRERGVTIMLTTHDLTDIERLCQRVIIIDHGRMIYDGQLAYIREQYATERQLKVVMGDAGQAREAAEELSRDERLALSLEEHVLTVLYDLRRVDTAELLRRIMDRVEPRDLTIQDESIESLVRRIYQGSVAGMARGAEGTVRGA